MKAFRHLVLVAAVLLSACASAPVRPAGPKPLILISIDGFRADYLGRGVTPVMSRLAAEGARAESMRPSFPSVTFPNHYTLVTGLRPDHHGIVNNSLEDPRWPDERFTMASKDAKWWDQGEAIWVTAEKAHRRTAVMFWPGSEALVQGVMPTRWKVFDSKFLAEQRVDQLLAWIKSDRPAFAALYFDDVDTAGHNFGPDAPETNAAAARVDAAIGRLLAGLKAQGLGENDVNIIVAADHGMTKSREYIFLDDIAKGSARVVATGAVSNIEPLPGRLEEAEALFVGRHEHMTCWDKAHVPPRFHYGTNDRIPPIVCLADLGYYGMTHTGAVDRKISVGIHGADPNAPDMSALFLAHGPSIKRGVVVNVMDNVDVYPMAMKLLALPPRPNDGDPDFPGKVLN